MIVIKGDIHGISSKYLSCLPPLYTSEAVPESNESAVFSAYLILSLYTRDRKMHGDGEIM